MTRSDDTILDFLAESEHAYTPRTIEYNINTRTAQTISRRTVARRLKTLREHDYVTREAEGIYAITEKGKKYLSGDLDPDDLDNGG